MTLSRLHPQKITLKYELFPNSYQYHLRAFWWYTGGVALPVLLAHVGLWDLFRLSYDLHFAILCLVGSIFYAAIRYYLGQQPLPANSTLTISEQTIEVRQGDKACISVNKADLRFEMIGWGPCTEELLPAVRIYRDAKLLWTIGASKSDENWKNIRRSVQTTDMVLPPQTDWKIFTRALSAG